MVNGKACRICGKTKAFSEYYAKPSCRDGLDTQCKECYKARRNAQAAENRKDPEYVAKRNAQSRKSKANSYTNDIEYREKEKQRSREWCQEQYDNDMEYRAKEQERNRKKCNEAYATDPEYRLKQIARQHARRHDTIGTFSHEDWIAVLEHFEYQCAYCGEPHNLTVEHIIPISKRGTNYIYNLIPACAHCNGSKGAKDIVEWYTAQDFYSEHRLLKIHAWYMDMQQYIPTQGGDLNEQRQPK